VSSFSYNQGFSVLVLQLLQRSETCNRFHYRSLVFPLHTKVLTMTNLTATVAKVKLGNFEIDGLLFDDGSFGVSIPQANELISFSASNNTASRDLKRILGDSFSPSKAKIDTSRQLINTLSLLQLESLIVELSAKGNIKALEINRSLVGLSLVQLFSDAFGVKFEKEERKAWLESRVKTKNSFWFLTDDIKDYLENHESSNHQFHYINAFKTMSVGLFGKTPSTIKSELNLTKGELNRDCFGAEALSRIDVIQKLARVNIINGLPPTESVKVAIATFNYKPIDYKD